MSELLDSRCHRDALEKRNEAVIDGGSSDDWKHDHFECHEQGELEELAVLSHLIDHAAGQAPQIRFASKGDQTHGTDSHGVAYGHTPNAVDNRLRCGQSH